MKRAPSPNPKPGVYGFVVHPLDHFQLGLFHLWRLGRGAGPFWRFPLIQTVGGAQLRGILYGVPLLPRPLMEDQERSVALIREAVRCLGEEGADAVGLGGLCAVVGSRGRAVGEGSTLPLTTGNHLTAWAALRSFEKATAALDVPTDEAVLVVGAPGPVAVAVAEQLARVGRAVRLAVKSGRGAIGAIVDRHPGIELVSLSEALPEASLIVSASSGGGAFSLQALRPGALAVDVARPRDIVVREARSDVLLLDGEMVSLPPGSRLDTISRIYSRLVGQRDTHVFACFAAPMLLAASGVPQPIPGGRFMDVEKVESLGSLAEEQGFRVDRLYSRGHPLASKTLDRFRSERSDLLGTVVPTSA